ncbi:MAG: 1,4-dihydroxy-2-naphthoate octaprenyltransferase [Spirochaetia bacterium]
MDEQHDRSELLSLMETVPVATVATAAGEGPRVRMMHYATNENFDVYLASMKGDPKTVQMTHHPAISLLVHHSGSNPGEEREIEISGRALLVKDPAERQHALETLAKRSPVVKHLTDTGESDMLECIRVEPVTVKYRVFAEIVQGKPPTVLEFPRNPGGVSDWSLLKLKIENWIIALRAPFLTASLVPVLLGTAVAWTTAGPLSWGIFLLTLFAALLLHAGANLMNDYFDHKSGNDEANREFVRPFSGGSRVIQMGLLTPLEVLSGSLLFLAISTAIGIYLAVTKGPLIFGLGAVGLVSAVFYTAGPFNWSKRGVGEIVIGVNFGILMSVGAYYVQTQRFDWLPVIASIPLSLLIAAVLFINEFPDYNADKQVGKRTLVVRLGRNRAVVLYATIMAAVYVSIGAGVAWALLPPIALLGLVTLPLALRAVLHAVKNHSSSFDLIPANALTVTIHLTTGLLLTLAYAWDILRANGIQYVIAIGVVFVAFTLLMYRHIEKKKNVFLSLKQAIR